MLASTRGRPRPYVALVSQARKDWKLSRIRQDPLHFQAPSVCAGSPDQIRTATLPKAAPPPFAGNLTGTDCKPPQDQVPPEGKVRTGAGIGSQAALLRTVTLLRPLALEVIKARSA